MTHAQTLSLLRAFESRNITFMERDGSWPIVWARAKGVHVWDAEGKKYLDLTAAFGVAAAGHANTRVVKAGQRQMESLLHAMGDVHPHELKARLARELSRLTFERWQSGSTGKTIFCNSGFEAVEAALKTALLATGKPGVIAFQGAYHGVGYGALNTTHRDYFRSPFKSQLRRFGFFVPFPTEQTQAVSKGKKQDACSALPSVESQIRQLFRHQKIGAILVEPVQVRGGINFPHPHFLPMLRRLCTKHDALLIFDEIYTGFGRSGKWFAGEHFGVAPDLICLGKALTGGFPLSACVGRADLMDAAWPPSTGEAIHTSTFLGHPVGCAMALAQIREIKSRNLVQRSRSLGRYLRRLLAPLNSSGYGREAPANQLSTINHRLSTTSSCLGLLAGVELRSHNGMPTTQLAMAVVKTLLHRGFIFLPEGEHSNVISLTPPLTISKSQLLKAVDALKDALANAQCAGSI